MPERFVSIVVEDLASQAVLERVLATTGHRVAGIHMKSGKHRLDAGLNGYNAAAKHGHWLVLRDMNSDAECAPELVARLLPNREETLMLRLAVREVESWLLADQERVAKYLQVRRALVPRSPDEVRHPKEALVHLASLSRNRDIRRDMVPPPGLSVRIGPAYNYRIREFVSSTWDPDEAATRSDSLRRCLRALRSI